MKKINNKGFVLAELLVVTVFLMVIFSMLYSNFYPLLAEYEKRETYDDVDSKYAVYWLKKTIEDASYQLSATDISNINANGYINFNCSSVSVDNQKRATCISLVKKLEVKGCNNSGNNCNIYITNYKIGPDDAANQTFKKTIKDGTLSTGLKAYVASLPDYKKPSLNNAKYRVIAVFYHKNQYVTEEGYYTYATIEVKK